MDPAYEAVDVALENGIRAITDPRSDKDLPLLIEHEGFAATVTSDDEPARQVLDIGISRLDLRQSLDWMQNEPTLTYGTVNPVAATQQASILGRQRAT